MSRNHNSISTKIPGKIYAKHADMLSIKDQHYVPNLSGAETLIFWEGQLSVVIL